MSKDGFASGFAFGYDPTGCSIFIKMDRIHYFDIRYSLFDIRYSLFQSFFLDLTDRPPGADKLFRPATPLIENKRFKTGPKFTIHE
jgi:hypothetical protein